MAEEVGDGELRELRKHLAIDGQAIAGVINPSLANNPNAAFMAMMRMFASSVNVCTPAVLVSYDRVTHWGVAQPLCNSVTNIGDSIERPAIKVHVIRFASGMRKIKDPTQPEGYRITQGSIIDIPLVPGDTGWLIASDSDTSIQLRTNNNYVKMADETDEHYDAGPSKPNTNLTHTFRNGLFIPDSFCPFPDIARFGNDLVIGTFDSEGIITNSGVGGGGGISMFLYSQSAQKVSGGIISAQRKSIWIDEYDMSELNPFPKSLWIKVNHANGQTVTAEFYPQNYVFSDPNVTKNPTDSNTYIPLYDFNDDKSVLNDYRVAPCVPLYGA